MKPIKLKSVVSECQYASKQFDETQSMHIFVVSGGIYGGIRHHYLCLYSNAGGDAALSGFFKALTGFQDQTTHVIRRPDPTMALVMGISTTAVKTKLQETGHHIPWGKFEHTHFPYTSKMTEAYFNLEALRAYRLQDVPEDLSGAYRHRAWNIGRQWHSIRANTRVCARLFPTFHQAQRRLCQTMAIEMAARTRGIALIGAREAAVCCIRCWSRPSM